MASDLDDFVIEGSEGFLYLRGGKQRVLDFLTGVSEIPPHAFERFERNLEMRAAYAKRVGARYLHCVAPDKHSVVRAHFPIPIRCITGEAFGEKVKTPFMFPVDALRDCPASFGYLKTDTHMNFEGRLAFAQLILRQLGMDMALVESRRETLAGLKRTFPHFSGDLGSKLNPPQTEKADIGVQLDRHGGVLHYSNYIVGNNGLIAAHFNLESTTKDRLLIFGDSFVLHCLPMLSLFFRETLFLRTPYFHPELSDAFQPTHILTSNAERYLPNTSNDLDAPLGLLMAALSGKPWTTDLMPIQAINAALQPTGPRSRNFWHQILTEHRANSALPGKVVRV